MNEFETQRLLRTLDGLRDDVRSLRSDVSFAVFLLITVVSILAIALIFS